MLRGQPHSGGAGKGAPAGIWSVWRRLAIVLAGGALTVAGLVGCNSADADPDPEPEPPTGPGTTEPEPEPEPTGPGDEVGDGEPDDDPPGQQEYEHPEPGEDIEDEGQAGAEAAAVYFVELFPYVYGTGDVEIWNELSAEECGFCAVVREDAANIHSAGGYAEASPPVIREVSSQLDPARSGAYVVELDMRDGSLQTFDSAGELIEDLPASDVHAWVLVEQADEGWAVHGVEAEATD